MKSIDNIHQSIDNFAKLAGVLQVPAKLFSDVSAWARSVFCSRVLWQLDYEMANAATYGEPYKRNYIFTRALCLQNIIPNVENPQAIPISLKDSIYISSDELGNMQKRNGSMNVLCRFIFSKKVAQRIYSGSEWKGLWNGSVYLFKNENDLPMTERSLKDELTDINETVRHELQHLIQSYAAEAKAIENDNGEVERVPWVGIPGKKIKTPDYHPSGQPKMQEKINPKSDKLDHDLRDIEFYPMLSDTIAAFKNIVNQVPLPLRKMFFSVWVGQINDVEFMSRLRALSSATLYDLNEEGYKVRREYEGSKNILPHNLLGIRAALDNARHFFFQLKNNQPGKYQKAVKEMFKILSNDGIL